LPSRDHGDSREKQANPEEFCEHTFVML
jgi:hypothetical protein